MTYSFTSFWKSPDADVFKLQGVLVAGSNEIGCYFPDDAEEQQEWTGCIQQLRQQESAFTPREWLTMVVGTGNGMTTEFAEIEQLEAPSLAIALTMAYQQTFQHHGAIMSLYAAPVKGRANVSSDPLGHLLSEIPPVKNAA